MVKVEKLIKNYGSNTVLKGVSFEVQKGEIFALLGANGAGKTTTLECIEGIREFESGTIEINGINIKNNNFHKIIGVQLQSTSLPANITTLEAFRLFCKWNKAKPDIRLLDTFGLTEIQNKQYKAMSTGQKRRLHLALALAHAPEVIFLDEPTAGLDVEGRVALHAEIRKLKDKGKTIVLSSHDMAEVETLCDRIAIIKDGVIKFIGTPDMLKNNYRTNTNIYIKLNENFDNYSFSSCDFISEDGEYCVFSAKDTADGMLELLNHFKSVDNKVLDIKIDHPTLEEKFMEFAKDGAI